MKKLTVFVCVLFVLVASIAGCGDTSKKGSTGPGAGAGSTRPSMP